MDVISKCDLKSEDVFFLFEPTSPFRRLSYLNKIIQLYEKERSKSVVSVYEAMAKSYAFQYKRSSQGKLIQLEFNDSTKNIYRRQDLEASYLIDGSFYSSTVKNFVDIQSFISDDTDTVVTDLFTSLEIDSKEDFQILELIFERFGSPF